MLPFQEKQYQGTIPSGNCLLVADVGGTNTTFGFMKERKERNETPASGKFMLLLTIHFPSQAVTDFSVLVKEVRDYAREKYDLTTEQIGIAGAGLVSATGEEIPITKLPWTINARNIAEKTGITPVLLNDFAAVAYGLDVVDKEDIVEVKSGTAVLQGTSVLLGAGTGLGKSILVFDKQRKRYVPLPSEGGHSSAALENEQEFALGQFIQEKEQHAVIAWDDLLTGKGIQNIYQFLEQTGNYSSPDIGQKVRKAHYDPALISPHQDSDPLCHDTFELFTRFYARCARNFALDALTVGGVYLAGGITAKNISIFQRKVFKDEFIHTKKMQEVLHQIPIYAVKDYNIGLYGAAVAVELKERGAL